ncbi:MAG: endonuclease domain-containing protein [Bradyrhizobiaceae bacterium]|nr:MAG: endonuclease domain-containing protein [Bradyrhizobiaceae bacterium]
MDDHLQDFARRMRAQPTDAERTLWHRLRHDIVLSGSHFRRQAVIGAFVVDFASLRAGLVIELDGGQHSDNAADLDRTRRIEERGYRVLRFWNHDVLSNIDGVLAAIQSALPPTPDPSPQGGGEARLPSAGDPPPQGEGDAVRGGE